MTSKQGHLLVSFADDSKLKAAEDNLDKIKDSFNITVDKKDMLKPKIMICDVDVDEDDDRIIETIKDKNRWISNMIIEDDDFKLIKKKKSRRENKEHIIVKCSPEVRQAVYKRDNKLYTTYGVCTVYDTYRAYQCYRCQEFGHSANNCSKTQVCAKCSGEHKTKDCSSDTPGCKNCMRKGHSDTGHATYFNKCPVYLEEIARIKNKTDHGF